MFKNLLILSLLILSASVCFAQEQHPSKIDTNIEAYHKWTKLRPVLRVGTGVEQSVYGEVGIDWHTWTIGKRGMAGKSFYTALEFVPTVLPVKDESIFGLKAGAECTGGALALGIEGKYQTNGSDNDVVLTPKIGIGVFDILCICYGYNISFTGSPFPQISHNQFSFIINIDKSGGVKKHDK